MLRRGALAMMAALVIAAPAAAHHGWSEYDSARPLEFAGVIEQPGYEHSHGHIRLKTDAKVRLVVLAPPSRMDRRGLAASELKASVRLLAYL